MEKEVTDRRIEKTKASLQKALLELSKEKELSEISISELTQAAQVHRNTFYSHYTDIYSVLAELEEEMCRTIKEMTEDFTPVQFRDNVDKILVRVFHYLYEQREKSTLMMRQRGAISSGKNLLESIFEKYFLAFPNGADRESLEFQVQFRYCTEGAMGIVRYWMEHDFKESPETMADITGKLLLRGIQGAINCE